MTDAVSTGHGLHLHLDPVGGAAGDMFIAAMLHAFPELAERALADVAAVLPAEVGHAELTAHVASGITARRFELVLTAPDAGTRHGAETTYRAMRELLENAPLSDGTAKAACAILHRIAEAEAQVHDIPIDRVHFHEIADWDALMDVTAAGSICAALSEATFSLAPLPLGGGLVETAHGKLPVPAPATALILQGYDWHDDGVPGERVTPTGAAILAHVTDGSPTTSRPPGRLRCTGSGAGMRVMKGLPNILGQRLRQGLGGHRAGQCGAICLRYRRHDGRGTGRGGRPVARDGRRGGSADAQRAGQEITPGDAAGVVGAASGSRCGHGAAL